MPINRLLRHANTLMIFELQSKMRGNPLYFWKAIRIENIFKKPASCLEKDELLEQIDLREGGGSGNLRNAWKGFSWPLSDVVPQKVLPSF